MPASDRSNEHKNFLDLFRTLPRGGFAGTPGPAIGIARSDDRFVGPTLRVVETSSTPNVTLISARGATGKSALARRLSSGSQVPLWDLGLDRGVSGDALASRLAEYLGPDGLRLFSTTDGAFLIVDALDEARMRVSAQSWTEFLDSLADACQGGHRFVLLGRERILEDVWVHLDDSGRQCAWYEISHFDSTQRVEYIDRYYDDSGKDRTEVYCAARDAALRALAGTVDSQHSESFVGYAPVLDAVVTLLVRENPMKILNTFSEEIEARDRVEVLQVVLERLLLREQEKVGPSAREMGLEPGLAYTPDEQVAWLASELMDGSAPQLDWCPADKRVEYADKVSAFLRDHPFRSEKGWASPVFAASIGSQVFGDVRVRLALAAIARGTGLLFDFVLSAGSASELDEWQFAALHHSMLAAEWQDVTAEVAISRDAADWPVADLTGQLYLAEGARARGTDFSMTLDRPGELHVYGPTAFMSISFPTGQVVFRDLNGSATLGPDAYISSASVHVGGEAVEVARRPPQAGLGEGLEVSVVIEVEDELRLPARLIGSIPADALELRVPDHVVLAYPWITYRQPFVPVPTAPDERARRFLNMLMTLLRRHGHEGPMAVFDKKLQGRQSIKHSELTAVLRALETVGVVRYTGDMIFLEPAWEPHLFDGKARPGLPSLDDKLSAWGPVLDSISGVLAS